MNRALSGLLLVFGLIVAATLIFFFCNHRDAPRLTASPAATVAPASPLQIAAVERRRPDMLLVSGKAPAGAHVTLTMEGQRDEKKGQIGTATAGSDGTFQITTETLPRQPALPLTLSVAPMENGVPPLQLLVVDRQPQPLTLVRGLAGWQPLSHPVRGSDLLLVAEDSDGISLSGQAPADATLYVYADNTLVRKVTTPGDTISPALFTLSLPAAEKPQDNLRIDGFDTASARPVAQLSLDLDHGAARLDNRDWQKVQNGDIELYIWRDKPAETPVAAFEFHEFPGQFTPVKSAAATPAQN